MQNAYILVDTGIVLFVGGKPSNIDKSHVNFSKILDAVRNGEWDQVDALANVVKSVAKFCDGKIVVDPDSGSVSFEDEELHGTIVKRILDMMAEGFSVDPLVNFITNLMQNPSKRTITELYTFVDYGKMPITPDGCFLAYKRVNTNYTSVHDGKTLNAPADKMTAEQLASLPLTVGAVTTSIENDVTVMTMLRGKVDDQSENTCSTGLHFCSHEYLKSFSGSKVVVLKVNPRDVASIPTDYNNTKGRSCRYEVVGELSPDEVQRALGDTIWQSPVVDTYSNRTAPNVDVDGAEVCSVDYNDGYQDGYKNGRYDDDTYDGYRDFDCQAAENDYDAGFERGSKDGRGHKTKVKFNVQ